MPVFSYEKTFEIDNSDAAFLCAFARVVASRGVDYIYDNGIGGSVCFNVDFEKNCGSCLIGTVLVSMGVPVEWFKSRGLNEGNAVEVLSQFGFSDRIQTAALRAQNVQDKGKTWGRASDAFFTTYANSVPS